MGFEIPPGAIYVYILSMELSVEGLFQSDPEILSQPIAQVPFCSSVRLPSSSIINLDQKYITRAVCKIEGSHQVFSYM